jgi:hypothetical protein
MSTGWILSGIAAAAIAGVALPSHLNHPSHGDFVVRFHEIFNEQSAGQDQMADEHQALIKLFSDPSSTTGQRSKALQALKTKARAHMAKMFATLEVNAAQRRTIDGLFDQGFAQMGKLLADKHLSEVQKKAKLESLHKAMFARLHTILSPAQIEKLHDLMQNQHGGTTP